VNKQEMMRILDSIARDRGSIVSSCCTTWNRPWCPRHASTFNTLDTEEFTCTVDPMSGEMTLLRHGEPLVMPPRRSHCYRCTFQYTNELKQHMKVAGSGISPQHLIIQASTQK
jgi:hypothetical protein